MNNLDNCKIEFNGKDTLFFKKDDKIFFAYKLIKEQKSVLSFNEIMNELENK